MLSWRLRPSTGASVRQTDPSLCGRGDVLQSGRGFCDPCTVQHDPERILGLFTTAPEDHRTGVRLSGIIKMDLCPVYGKQSADLRITERGDS